VNGGSRVLPALVINLARSSDRWSRIAGTVENSGLALERVPAVDGAEIAAELRSDLDLARFRRVHGRDVLNGEYGCYRSHLNALRTVVESGYPLAIIAEDDIGFTPGMSERVHSIFDAHPQIDLLKLLNHRTSGFVRHGASSLGDEFGRCLHGPQGSAACYAVTRQGAARLLHALGTMWLPYDVAFERGWATGAATYTTHGPLATFEGYHTQTTIATREQYRDAKLPRISQIGTLFFRGSDYVSRMAYAVKGR
jgi:glycosyl transferase family 25